MLASFLLVGLIFYYFYYHFVKKRENLPPGPIPLPIVGNIFQLDRKAPHKTLAKWSQQYGPVFTMWMGPQANVFVTDFQLMKEYFIKQGDVFTGRPRNYVFEFFASGRYGMVVTEGPFWREQRRFSLHVLRDFGFGRSVMEGKIMQQVDTLVGQMQETVGQAVNLKHELELCVGNVINSLMFGFAFKRNDPNFLGLKRIFDENIELLGTPKMFLVNVYPWLRHLPIFGNFGFKQLEEHRDGFVGWVEKYTAAHKETFDESAEPTDYVSAYRKEMIRREQSGEDMGSFSEWQLKMAVGDFWAAGLETTVTTLKWGLLYMIHNPEIQEKCAQEIRNVLASRQKKVVQMADKSSMPFTAATVNEIQRLANLLPLNLQHAVTDDIVLDGYKIEKGTVVVPQMSAIFCDSKVFPDPEKFDPERFLEDNGKTPKKVEELVPFSVGKRMCLGESLARMELFLIFSTLIQKFKFGKDPEGEMPTLEGKPGFMHEPEEFKVYLEERVYE